MYLRTQLSKWLTGHLPFVITKVSLKNLEPDIPLADYESNHSAATNLEGCKFTLSIITYI